MSIKKSLMTLTLFFLIGIVHANAEETKIVLPAGFVFEASLETSIYSFNSTSPVVAIVQWNMKYLDKIAIPENSKVIGWTKSMNRADRVDISFNQIIFPNGTVIPFEGTALKLDGSMGIPGFVKYEEIGTHPKHNASISTDTLKRIQASPVAAAIIKSMDDENRESLHKGVKVSTGMLSAIQSSPAGALIVEGVEKNKALQSYSVSIGNPYPLKIFVVKEVLLK